MLRLATVADAAPLADLHTQDEGRPWNADEFASLLDTPGIEGLVALGSHGAITGFVLLRQVGPEAEIMALLVDRAARGRGVASLLMLQAISRLGRQGVRSLFLEVAEDNIAAIALYDGLGFAGIGRRRGYYQRADGKKTNARVLRLDLRGDEPAPSPGQMVPYEDEAL